MDGWMDSVYSKASCLTELAKLHLLESYCLPLLTTTGDRAIGYAIGSLKTVKDAVHYALTLWCYNDMFIVEFLVLTDGSL